ncbi:MAG: hypothetical protein H6Q55_1905 [Deltaproteobacteria bacterium]|nr:hypothetical protein [Deltaproteobacteria bacterium]
MRRTATLLAVGLLLAALSLITYRVVRMGYPLYPASPAKAWELSLEARVPPNQRNITIKIAMPRSGEAQTVVEERLAPGLLGFTRVLEGPNEVRVWSGNTDRQGDLISYDATVLLKDSRAVQATTPALAPFPDDVTLAEQSAAKRLVARWRQLPLPERLRALADGMQLFLEETATQDGDVQVLRLLEKRQGTVVAILTILRAADLPARVAEGFFLAEAVMATPTRWIEVWTGRGWEKLHVQTGRIYAGSAQFLRLAVEGVPVVRTSGLDFLDTRWTVSKKIISAWRSQFELIQRSDRLLDRWSLFSLPPQFEETFRILLLVPIGALMICVLRNIIGFPTFGIFMPVLMALAFRSTGLLYGLAIFGGVLCVGYLVRRWIDKLRLLLVPRLSVMVTLVICCFTMFALVGSKFGLRELMAVGLLPFVILTMTIERFFITVEESGAKEAFKMALGSAAVAATTHEIIHIEGLQLTFFVYPELLLAVGAFQMLVGRYTGYRLLEYLRFKAFRRPS